MLTMGISYAYGNFVRSVVITKIKNQNTPLYKSMLGERSISWIERGWYDVQDMPIHWRLHKYVYAEGYNFLGKGMWFFYRVSVWFTLLAFVLFWPGLTMDFFVPPIF